MPRQALPQAHRRLAKAAGPGWSFFGAWPADDRALIEATLQRRVLKGVQPADDRWIFTCIAGHVGLLTYAAWQPGRMAPTAAFVASSAPELAEDLWAYYFERSLDLPMAPSLEAIEAVRRIDAALDPAPDLHLYFATQQQVCDRMREAQACLDTRDFLGARLAAEAALQDANVLISPLLAHLFTLHGAACAGLDDVDAAQTAFAEAIRQAGGSPVIPAGQDFPDPFATVPPRLALARLLLDQHALDAADRCLQDALASCERAMDDPNLRSGATVSYAEGLSRLVALALRRGHQHVALSTAERALAALNRHPSHHHAWKVRILADLATTLRDHHALPEARMVVDRGLRLANTYVRADDIGMVPVLEQLHRLHDDLAIRGLPARTSRKRTRAAVPLPQAAMNAIRAVDDPWFRSWALADLAPAVPASLLDDAVRLAQAVDDPWAQAYALGRLAAAHPGNAPPTELVTCFTAVLEDAPEWSDTVEDFDHLPFIEAVAALASQLPAALLAQAQHLVDAAVDRLARIAGPELEGFPVFMGDAIVQLLEIASLATAPVQDVARALVMPRLLDTLQRSPQLLGPDQIDGLFPPLLRLDSGDDLIMAVQACPDACVRSWALMRVAVRQSDAILARSAIAAVPAITWTPPHDRQRAHAELLPLMDQTAREAVIQALLAYIQWVKDHGARHTWMADLLVCLAPYVGEDAAEQVRVLAAQLPQRLDRVRVMARVIPRVTAVERPSLLEEVRRLAETIRRPDTKAQALVVLATQLSHAHSGQSIR